MIPARISIEPGRLNNSHGFSYPSVMYLYSISCVLFINDIVGDPFIIIEFELLYKVSVVMFLWFWYMSSSVIFIGLLVFIVSINVEFIGMKYDDGLGGLINVYVVPEFSSVFVNGTVDIIVRIMPMSAIMRPDMNCLFLMNLVFGILCSIDFTYVIY